MKTLLILFVLSLGFNHALAHDFWITPKRNGAGEWCCGKGDCALLDPKAARSTATGGYIVSGWGTIEGDGRREFYHEDVPAQEVMPSVDGGIWRCKRPDGSRRCFFAPPPNT